MVDLIEDEVEVCGDRGDVGLHQVDENVDGIGIHPSTLIATGMEDGGTNVAREGIGLGGRWFGRVMLCGDWLGVQVADNVDVGVADGSDGGGGCGTCDGCAELVGVCCSLGSLVVGCGCRGGVL